MKIKLETTEYAAQSLSETNRAYVVVLNHTSQVAFEKKVFNSVALHHVTYQDVRALTKLPANLVCSARNVVAEAYKRDKEKRHRWKDASAMRYDARTLTVKLDQEYATLTTLDGRVRVSLILSDYHRQYLDGTWEVEPTAMVSRNGRIWYLHLIVTRGVPDSESDGVIGVDSGVRRIATVNTGKTFNGGIIKHIRERRFKQRRDLQSARHKSRNQRRLLKRLAGKEKRSVDWLLWNVANGIIGEALKVTAGTIAVEDLKGIRTRIKCAKKQRLIMHGWPFSSLFLKIAHVASKHGIKVESVDARNTSRTCRCGHVDKANRTTQSTFRCVVCSYSHNADYVASHNIAVRYVEQRRESVTTRPRVRPPGQG
ncbi:MAG TPA: transposase [Blastocatellia bacterium]